jgi:predicted  nucleic acid-binding Zn-ribbon protein
MIKSPLIERCSEKFGKKLIGRTEMEDALKKLDKLTQEEARMAVAQNLKATYTVDDRVRGVANTVTAIDSRVADVNDQVAGVDDRVARVGDRIAGIDERIASVARATHVIEDWVRSQEHELVMDDRVASIDDPVAEVINGAQIIFSQA